MPTLDQFAAGKAQHQLIVDTRPDDVVQHPSLGPLAVYQMQVWPADDGGARARAHAVDAQGYTYTTLKEIADRGDALAWPSTATVARWSAP